MGFKPACSATESSKIIEISLVASLDVIHSKWRNNKGADQTARMGRLVCVFGVCKHPKTGFLASGPILDAINAHALVAVHCLTFVSPAKHHKHMDHDSVSICVAAVSHFWLLINNF